MTIIEAMKSGRPFRRKGWDSWIQPSKTGVFYSSEILADDWEIQPEVLEFESEIELFRSTRGYEYRATTMELMDIHGKRCRVRIEVLP